jgi:urea transport system substrate-binding protein
MPPLAQPQRFPQPVSRRRFLQLTGYASAGMGLATSEPTLNQMQLAVAKTPTLSNSPRPNPIANHRDRIKVGILHSRTGTMAIDEERLIEAELLAIAELNRKGGVLGRRIEPVIEDGASDWPTFQEKAKKLITQDKVATVFGGWTSASRKAMLALFESFNHMLWYPVYYEGQECSKNIFYLGTVPNQKVEPTVNWVLSRFPKQPIFLVGSDYVFPRVVNTIATQQIANSARSIMGEDYLPLGNTEMEHLMAKIKNAMPNGGVILNSFNGDTNVAFFKQLNSLGMSPKRYPVVSFGVDEGDVLAIGAEYLKGHYAAWSYFQNVNIKANTEFKKSFQAKYGRDVYFNDAMQSAYTAVYLWRQAVEKAATATDLEKVRAAAIGQSFNAPEGKVTLTKNHHLTKHVRIGQMSQSGRFAIVYEIKEPIMPQPWSQRIQATRGVACDWSNPARGGKYKT